MDASGLTDEEFQLWWKELGAEQLAEILYWRWDPFGMNEHFPNTRGEYNDYLEPLVDALKSGASAEAIERQLKSIETNEMGLAPVAIREERRPEVAEFLFEYWFAESIRNWRQYPDSDWRNA